MLDFKVFEEVETDVVHIVIGYGQEEAEFYRIKEGSDYLYNAGKLIDMIAKPSLSVLDSFVIIDGIVFEKKRLEFSTVKLVDFFIKADGIEALILNTMGLKGAYFIQELQLNLFELEI
jgi:hypothetical protein